MRDINRIIVAGRLGANPVLRYTKSGFPVTHLSVATSRKIKSQSEVGEMREETQWHRIVVWGKQGEACAQYLKKGSAVFIEGMVRSHPYEGKDGITRMAFEVYAESVSFLSGIQYEAPSRQDTVVAEEPVEVLEEATVE